MYGSGKLPYSSRSPFWPLPVLLLAAGLLALAIDVPLAQWCLKEGVSGDLRKLLQLSEVFGHGLGIVAILITVLVLDRRHRWAVPRLAMASLGAGLAANLGKLLIARVRPHHFDFTKQISASFIGWLPLASGPSYEQACPSAHTAAAAGLAVGLTWLYPQGRRWFTCLAVLVALQRIEAGAHFLSDTLWGAALGTAIARVAVAMPSLGLLGNRLERWLGKPSAEPGTAENAMSRAA
jgi:membrane-associated phospholipid phosphatase